MNLTRRIFLGAAAAAPVVAAAWPARAMSPETFQTNGVAINGIDPVAYFTNGAPMAGSAAYAANYKGAAWHFASAANRRLTVNPSARTGHLLRLQKIS